MQNKKNERCDFQKAIDIGWIGKSISQANYEFLLEIIKHIKSHNLGPVIVFGDNISASFIVKILKESNIPFWCVSENDSGNTIYGETIYTVEEFKQHSEAYASLINTTHKGNEYIINCFPLLTHENIFKTHFSDEESFLENYSGLRKDNILAISDCFFSNVSIDDELKSSVGALLKERIDMDILSIAGLNPSGFFHILCAAIANGKRPHALLLGATPLAFSEKRPFLPGSQHARIFETIGLNYNNYDYEQYCHLIKERERNLGDTNPFVRKYDENTLKRTAFVFTMMNYAYKWNDENENVIYLHKLINLCKEKNIRIYPIIPPANHQLIEHYCDNKYISNYDAIMFNLKKIFCDYGIKPLSLDEIIDSQFFADDLIISETLNFQGREKAAIAIKKYISEN